MPVIELLDDDVDPAPTRHLPPPAAADGVGRLSDVRGRLGETLRLTTEPTPPPSVDPGRPPPPGGCPSPPSANWPAGAPW